MVFWFYSWTVFGFFTAGISGLTMNPSGPILEITSGMKYEVNCSSNVSLIRWNLMLVSEQTESDFKVTNYEKDGVHTSVLLIEKAEYYHTGSFICSDDSGFEKELYLYVNDDEHPLAVFNQLEIINGIQNEDIIIPCKPTSPSIPVFLRKENEDRVMIYDAHYGFRLNNLQITDSGTFKCTATYKGKSPTHQFHLIVNTRTSSLQKPKIKSVSSRVLLGETFRVECHTVTERNTYTKLEWDSIPRCGPKLERICQEQLTSSANKNNKFMYLNQNTLIIRNVTLNDQKRYTCSVNDHLKNHAHSFYDLRVISPEMEYLNLSMEGDNELLVRLGEKSARWSVIIDAHPHPNITWYDFKGNVMPTNSAKYIIDTSDNYRSTVKINDVGIKDCGIYQIEAVNNASRRTLNVTLLVEDVPSIECYPKKYYNLNEDVFLKYEITGYPVPELECEFISPISEPVALSYHEYYDHSNGVKYDITFKIKANRTGTVKCQAGNRLGSVNNSVPFVVTDVNDGFDLWGPKSFVLTSDNVTIGCGSSITYYYPELEWILKINDEWQTVSNSSDMTIINGKTNFSIQSFLNIRNIQLNHSTEYICRAHPKANHSLTQDKKISITVKDMLPSYIYGELANSTGEQMEVGDSFVAICNATGLPTPSITWYKDNNILEGNQLIRFKEEYTILEIPYIRAEDAGIYKCFAHNRAGNSSKDFELLIKERFPWDYLGIIILVLLISILLLYFLIKTLCKRMLRRKQKDAILNNFNEGQIDSLNPELNIHDQADLLPYDEKWEFPRDKLKLGKQLGSGAFGVVLKAEAFGLNDNDEPMIVAVKMVKKNSNFALIKALTSELKLMANLGQHLNVVNLIGACTKNIHNGELLVLVEYCRFGNLHNYLLRHRDAFINQINPETGVIEMVTRNKVLELAYFSGPSNCTRTNDSQMSEYSNFQTGNTQMTSISTPVGDDGYLISKEPELKSCYEGDYKASSVRPICTQDLLCWSYQVARGMEYLASRKVLHGDLAARNILLADGNVVKICDFGLARNMYSGNYCKKGDDPLPVKWMSIEALRDRIFSTQSDIWAFGIVLWEMFALAKTPYPGIQFGSQFFNKLLEGYRMEKPEYSTDEIYKLMQDCWLEQPMSRPTFTECAERIGNMLEDSVKQHYTDLNDPYLKLNEQMPSQSDYLSMLNAPTFANFSSVSVEGPSEGYVNMQRIKSQDGDAMELKPMLHSGNKYILDIKSFLNPGYEGLNRCKDNTYVNVPQQPTIQV